MFVFSGRKELFHDPICTLTFLDNYRGIVNKSRVLVKIRLVMKTSEQFRAPRAPLFIPGHFGLCSSVLFWIKGAARSAIYPDARIKLFFIFDPGGV